MGNIARILAKMSMVGLPLFLSGCGFPPAIVAFSYAMDGISFASSGKSVTDHALSAAVEQDCAMFRAIQGKDICNDAGPVETGDTVLAEAKRNFDGDGIANSTASRTEIATANRSRAKSWNIRAGRDVGKSRLQLASSLGISGSTFINPNQAPVKMDSLDGHPETARLMNFPASTEVYALLQEDGTLEIFAYGSGSQELPQDLAHIATYENFSDNPSALRGVSIGGAFHTIGDLMV
jgi:hypothetical protein